MISLVNTVDEVLQALYENWMGLTGSITAIASGVYLVLDDIHDYPELIHDKQSGIDTPLAQLLSLDFKSLREPSGLPHHWLIGLLVFLGGCLGLIVVCSNISRRLKQLEQLRLKREGKLPQTVKKPQFTPKQIVEMK